MKVLLCKDALSIGGITTYIMHLQESLKANYELHLICTHYKGNYFDTAASKFESAHVLEKNQNLISRLVALNRLIKSINPDFIILNHSPVVNMILPFLARRIKVISTIHNDVPRFYIQGSFYNPWIDIFICPSPWLKSVLYKKYKVPQEKIRTVPHGVRMPVQQGEKIKNSIVFIGNLDLHKGCDLLIPVFQAILQKVPSATLTIVGQGPKWSLIKDQLERQPVLKESVKLLSNVEPDEIYELLGKMEVLFFPTKLEGFGYVIPEAMINGVIPIVSNLPEITEQFVIDGVTGYLCDPNSPDCFSTSITNTLISKEKTVLAKGARNKAESEFALPIFAKNYNDLIQAMINKPNKTLGIYTVFYYLVQSLRVLRFKWFKNTPQ